MKKVEKIKLTIQLQLIRDLKPSLRIPHGKYRHYKVLNNSTCDYQLTVKNTDAEYANTVSKS